MADISSHPRPRMNGSGQQRAVASVLIVACVSAAAAVALAAIDSRHVANDDDRFCAQLRPPASAPSSKCVGNLWIQLEDGIEVAAEFQLGGRTIWLVSEPGGSGCPWFHRLVWRSLAGLQETTLDPCGAYVGTTVHDGQLMLVFHTHRSEDDNVPRHSLEVEEQLVPLMSMSAPIPLQIAWPRSKEVA